MHSLTRRLLIPAGLPLLLLAAGPAPAQAQQIASVTAPVISEQDIARRIASLVRERNGGRPVEIAFHGGGNDILLPPGAAAGFRIDGFAFDERSGRFSAAVLAAGQREPLRISGRAHASEALPVLRARVAPGETITKADIEWKAMPAGRYGSDYVDRADDLIGMTPKRPIGLGHPIRMNDVGRRELVTKNALVSMIAQAPGLTITLTGRAIEGGSTGDVIQVMNLQSKKMLQATVTGPNQVHVTATPRVVASN